MGIRIGRKGCVLTYIYPISEETSKYKHLFIKYCETYECVVRLINPWEHMSDWQWKSYLNWQPSQSRPDVWTRRRNVKFQLNSWATPVSQIRKKCYPKWPKGQRGWPWNRYVVCHMLTIHQPIRQRSSHSLSPYNNSWVHFNILKWDKPERHTMNAVQVRVPRYPAALKRNALLG